jgi:hypothetical protein
MRKHFGWLSCALIILSVSVISWKPAAAIKPKLYNKSFSAASALLQKYVDNIYQSAHLQESGMDIEVFAKAVTGFINLKANNQIAQNSSILTVVDLGKSSREKRMWIIDLVSKEIILNTWVAHGQGSGDDMADRFSDKFDSHQSSLGFYITDNVYYGKNGRSLHLDGLDEGFNTNARARAIVVHGADYVSPNTVEVLGRLGRSYCCPAVPTEVSDMVIDTIKDKTVMFISGNDYRYSSKYLDDELAANYIQYNTENNLTASL